MRGMNNIEKKWKEVKAGDTIYLVNLYKTTPQIIKMNVLNVKLENRGTVPYPINVSVITVNYDYYEKDGIHTFHAPAEYSVLRMYRNVCYYTTLGGAERKCDEIAERRLYEIKNEIKHLKSIKTKWENQITTQKLGYYTIK